MKNNIQIIIPSAGVNAENALFPAIKSLTETTDLKSGNVKILLVMNGMKDQEKFNNFLNPLLENKFLIDCIWKESAIGYVQAINLGLETILNQEEKPDYICFLNDDVSLHSSNWLDLLLKPFKDDPKMGLVGAKSLPCPTTGIDFPLGFCVLIKREVIEKIGSLDPIFKIGYNDDVDFAIRTIKEGYHIFSYINGFDKVEHKSIGDFPINHQAENTMHSGELFSREDWENQAVTNRHLLAGKYWEQVHIVVPVYKRYARLKKVLEDLYNQNYWKIKVHVVSDGHDEKVKEIVEETYSSWAFRSNKNIYPELEYSFIDPPDHHYGDGQRIKIINSLAEPVDCFEWICFLDSDNTVKPDWILKLWQSTFLQDVGGSWCRIQHTETGRNIPEPEFQNKPAYWHIDTLNMFVRLDIAKRHSAIWHRDAIGNDYNFATECFNDKPWSFVDEVLGSHGQDLSVLVMAVCRNEELIAPFFLRHYEPIADKIVIIEGGSTDKTLDILGKSPKVEIISIPEDKMNNRHLTDFRNEKWKEYKHDYDFVIVCDMDEFVYHPTLRKKLDEFKKNGITVPAIKGYQMVSEIFPHKYEGQIYNVVQEGYHDPQWLSKVSIFSPADIEVNYEVGCHQANPKGKLKSSDEPLYLLHFKYVGYSEFIERNKKLSERLSETDLKNGWAFHYARDAQMTIEQFRELVKKSTNLFNPAVVKTIPLMNRKDLREQNPLIFEEIVTKNSYRVSREDFVGKNVIDIGANTGIFSLLAHEYGAENILAVEPNPETAKVLWENIKDKKNITLVERAVGLRSGDYVEMVRLPQFSPTDGRVFTQSPTTGDPKNIVKTANLDYLIDLIGDDRPILLKVDIEGAEYDLFNGASFHALSKIDSIRIEMHENVHKTEGQFGLIDGLRRFLTTHGFVETFQEKPADPRLQTLGYERKLTIDKKYEVTVGIPTKNRYFSTLPPALLSVMMQTYPVKKLIVVDDSEPGEDGKMVDLRNDPMYQYLFSMISKKGIEWEVVWGQRKGQHVSHQIIMDKAKTELVWRIDDDEYAEPNVLEELVKQMKDGVGAVGGLVLNPKSARLAEEGYTNINKLNDIYSRENTQWVKQKEGQVFEVEHLYSSFLYRKVDDIKYCLDLSPAAHREESIFSHEYFRRGWKLLVTTNCTSWHFQNPSGGIRSYSDPKLWEHDEEIFKRKLESWKIDMEGKKLLLLDSGIGDAICFLEVLPEILKRWPKLIIGSYYKLLFKNFPNVEVIHPFMAKDILSEKGAELQNVYRYLWKNSDMGRKMHLIQAYRELFLEDKI